MKKILLSTVALLSLSAGAMAADLPSRRAAPAPLVAVPVFTWTGFYVGANVGWAFRDNNNDDEAIFFAPGTIVNGVTGTALATTGTLTLTDNDNNRDGITGGAQIGYNMQFGSIVLGVEADIQAADLNGGRNNGFGAGTYSFVGVPDGIAGLGTTTTVFRDGRRDIDWWGSVRARLGFAFDRFLVYGTGGFAFGGGSNNHNNCFAGAGIFGCSNNDDTRGGFAAGGGVEYALTNNMTVGVEGLFVSLNHDNNNNRGAAVFDPTTNSLFLGSRRNDDDDFGVVRAKLNFKF